MLSHEQQPSIHSTTVPINAATKKRFTFKHYFNPGHLDEPIKTAESLRCEFSRILISFWNNIPAIAKIFFVENSKSENLKKIFGDISIFSKIWNYTKEYHTV